MADEITLQRESGVATITLDAPDRRNALTRDMARELAAVCDEVDADPSVGAVVVQGAGGFFCAGGDRDTLAAAGRDPAEPEAYSGLGDVYRSFARVGELEPPTIAAIRGGAVGAGVNLAFATDLRIVAREAKIISGFLPIGLHPGGRPRRAAGPHRPARGRRGDGAIRRAHRRRSVRPSWAWPGLRSMTARWRARPPSWRRERRPTPSWPAAPRARCAPSGARLRCPGRPPWSWSARRRCGRCGASTSRAARARSPRTIRGAPGRRRSRCRPSRSRRADPSPGPRARAGPRPARAGARNRRPHQDPTSRSGSASVSSTSGNSGRAAAATRPGDRSRRLPAAVTAVPAVAVVTFAIGTVAPHDAHGLRRRPRSLPPDPRPVAAPLAAASESAPESVGELLPGARSGRADRRGGNRPRRPGRGSPFVRPRRGAPRARRTATRPRLRPQRRWHMPW